MELSTEVLSSAIQIPNCEISRVGLKINEEATLEEWAKIMHMLAFVQGSTLWWWGDAILFGNEKHGEKYAAAVEESQFAEQTLRNAKLVCKTIQMSRRRDKLSFTHHHEVAFSFSNDEVKQDEWLDKAEAESWSVSELRKQIRLSKATYTNEPDSDTKDHRAINGFDEFARWIVKQDYRHWPEESKERWKADLEPIVKVYKAIEESLA